MVTVITRSVPCIGRRSRVKQMSVKRGPGWSTRMFGSTKVVAVRVIPKLASLRLGFVRRGGS